MKVFGGPSRTRTCDPLIMSRGRGEKLRPFYFIWLRPKLLRVNELARFRELQEFHHVRLLSVMFGKITDTKTDTVHCAISGLPKALEKARRVKVKLRHCT
jgi:hypothetical protein